MKSSLNRLILLGFICQGLSWDDWVMPLLNVGLWFACLRMQRAGKHLGQTSDMLGMLLGCAAGGLLAEPFGASKHFFIGHGLTLLQASRLTRNLDRREKVFSLIVALGQIGVACTVVLDYRFILVLFATLILLPRTLAEIEQQRLVEDEEALRKVPRVKISWSAMLFLFGALVVFFFVTPRGLMGNAFRAPSLGAGSNNLLDDMLDPSFGGRANSSEILMQVDGRSVGYLRMFSLTLYNEGVWKSEPAPQRYILHGPSADMSTNLVHRSVRVKNANYLRNTIPYDGQITTLKGNFFRGAYINQNAVIETRGIWNTANNSYEYWIRPQPRPAPLNRKRQFLLRRHPPLSPELRQWLDERTAGAVSPFAKARQLEEHLSEEFTYQLGAPNLNRLSALEDFLLSEQRGHCERFASALALLLRAEGIPSRVVVGFVPGRKNWFSGWYDIRFRDAHAWTEAWFPDQGWVQLDATPRGGMDLGGMDIAELLDALDVMWYANFVNFSRADQQGVISFSSEAIREATAAAQTHLVKIVGLFIVLALIYVWRRHKPVMVSDDPKAERQRRIEYAENCYGQMLRMLSELGYRKAPHQTPNEFLITLKSLPGAALEPARVLTQEFCLLRYQPNSLAIEGMEQSLERLRSEIGTIHSESRSHA
ncbi:MAG: transglutaminase TgpA family protein [Limisphaerales bacterium]